MTFFIFIAKFLTYSIFVSFSLSFSFMLWFSHLCPITHTHLHMNPTILSRLHFFYHFLFLMEKMKKQHYFSYYSLSRFARCSFHFLLTTLCVYNIYVPFRVSIYLYFYYEVVDVFLCFNLAITTVVSPTETKWFFCVFKLHFDTKHTH